MIKSFQHKGLERFYRTGSKAGIQPQHAARLTEMLTALDVAVKPGDLAASASYGLHPLKAGLAGLWAIKVDRMWRLTFKFEGEDVIMLDYQDYH